METVNGIEHYGGQLVGWTLNNPEIMCYVAVAALAAAIAMGIALWMVLARRDNRPDDREARIKRMMTIMAQRKAKLDAMYADMIGDMLFELWFKGAISRQEYRRDSRRFGVKYKLLDLLPRRNKPQAIKARVNKNIQRLHEEKLAMRATLEQLKSGGFAVLEAKVQAMPNPDPLQRRAKLYVVRTKRLGLK